MQLVIRIITNYIAVFSAIQRGFVNLSSHFYKGNRDISLAMPVTRAITRLRNEIVIEASLCSP